MRKVPPAGPFMAVCRGPSEAFVGRVTGVVIPRNFCRSGLPVAHGCMALPRGIAEIPTGQTTRSRRFVRKTEYEKRSSGFSFLYKNESVCAHTWFFENNCIVLRCASGDRRPSFGNGRPASRGRMRRGGSERSGNPATGRFPRGRQNDRHADRRTDTRTYSAKSD